VFRACFRVRNGSGQVEKWTSVSTCHHCGGGLVLGLERLHEEVGGGGAVVGGAGVGERGDGGGIGAHRDVAGRALLVKMAER
jgi:hypothetical protein